MVQALSKTKTITFEEFTQWKPEERRYELHDGVIIEMSQPTGDHENIVKLYEVLELVQDSKTTLFLVMDLVTGGELFERMKNGQGMGESFSKR